MADENSKDSEAPPRTEAVPPAVPEASDSGISAWQPGTAGGSPPETPMPPSDAPGGETDIAAVRGRIAELQREIDRLGALVDGAVGKLSRDDGRGGGR
ncbi:hypothetical protein JL100_006290 [Skermanella mucosa]|uniref:hypothetical protein n=1 Tax=Skermanella mucosa TaxID=1789672 RepID=UPI00192CE0AF|nr:hypothetical protein [Skermanella mucosa]UEM22353.1 hypothetical protein JL100_006290 [Skermanella mucosa]